MSESRTIVVTIIGTGVALGALLIGLVMNQNLRIDDLRGDLTGQIDDLRGDLTGQIDDLRGDLTGQIDRRQDRHSRYAYAAAKRRDRLRQGRPAAADARARDHTGSRTSRIAAKRRARSTLHTNGHAPPVASQGSSPDDDDGRDSSQRDAGKQGRPRSRVPRTAETGRWRRAIRKGQSWPIR